MRLVRRVAMVMLICSGLTACGQEPPVTQPQATIASVSPTAAGGATVSGTASAAQLTLGDLAARVESAWPSLHSYRSTFTGATVISLGSEATPVAQPAATPGATPVARPRSTFVLTREVLLPDRQRQVVTGLGRDDQEAVVIGSNLFVRGPVAQRMASGTADTDWIVIDLKSLPAGSTLPPLLNSLREVPPSPLASLPDRLKPQVVRSLETVDFDGRTCHVYGAADTVADTGMRIDYTIAIDDQNVPCFIETSTGGTPQGRNEFTGINAPIQIEAPQGATPVSGAAVAGTPAPSD